MGLSVIGFLVVVASISLWPRPAKVQVMVVESGWLEVAIQQDGVTRIKDRYLVSAAVGGKLLRISLRPGDTIERGRSLLAAIQPALPTMLDARQNSQLHANVEAAKRQVDLAEARRDQARTHLQQAETNFGRLKTLKDEGSVSATEFEVAETLYRSRSEDLRVANFEWEIRGFELQQAEAARKHFADEDVTEALQFEIRAPIDGQVLRVFEESSTVVAAGTPLMEVGNASDLEIVIDVLSTDAVKIQPGNPVILEHWGGTRSLLAEVRQVEPAAFTKVSALGVEEQRVNVIADFREPISEISRLGDQYRVEARVVIWKADNVIKVPVSALFRHEGTWAVFVVADRRARLRKLDIGNRSESFAEVLQGLSAGETVVVYPSDALEDGDQVEITK